MARPGDAEDATHGTGEDDYTADPPEYRRDTEIPQDETEKRPLLARAIERIKKAADGARSTITSGFDALNRRTQKEGVQPPEPLDPNGFLEEEQQAEDTLGQIVEEVNGGTMDAAVARKQAAEINVNLVSGYQAKFEGPMRRFISWLKRTESQADAGRADSAGSEESSEEENHRGAETESVRPQQAEKGAPLSRLGEFAKKVFAKKAETGEFSDEEVERLLADADSRITTSKSSLQEEYQRMQSRLHFFHKRAGRSETEEQRLAVDTLLYSLRGRWNSVSIVEYINAKTALGEDIRHKRSDAYQRFEETIKTTEDNFHTFLAGIDEKMSPLDGGFEAGDQEAKERLLTEADIRVEAELNAMKKKVDPLMARIDSALSLSARNLPFAQHREIDGIKTTFNAEHQQFQDNIRYFHGRLQYAVENKTMPLAVAEIEFKKYIQQNVDHFNGRITLFEQRLETIISEAEAAGVPLPPEEPVTPPPPAGEAPPPPGAETLSDAERARLEQGVKDADLLVGAFETADDRYALALTELNRLSDPTLKSNIKHDLDLNLDRLIGMRNAIRNARDVLNDELSGRKKGEDTTRALSVVNEHNAPESDFHTRHANFFHAVSALEDALSAQDRAAVPAAEVSAEAPTDAPLAAEVSAPAPEAVTLPPDVQENLDAARAKVEQDARGQMQEKVRSEIDAAQSTYENLLSRAPVEFNDLPLLDKDYPSGAITVGMALNEIASLITIANGEFGKGEYEEAERTTRNLNAWIRDTDAVLDGEIAGAQKARAEAFITPDVAGDAGTAASPEAPPAAPEPSLEIPVASPSAGTETTEDPVVVIEKKQLVTRLQTYRDGVEASAKMLEAKCAGNPDLKSRLDKLNAQITRDFENVGTDLANSKTVEDIGKAERRIGEAYGNLIDALTTLTELAGATQLSLESQKKITELEAENASLKSRMADLEERMQAFIDAQTSGGTPATPGTGGPGAPGGPSGPGGGPPPPPGGSGPTGPGGPTPPEPPPAPEPGEPGDPEKAQAEAIKTELETTLIPEIQTALAGRDYLLAVKVLLPTKHPENSGGLNASERYLESHIEVVNAAPEMIDHRIREGTVLEARQFAQNAKVRAEAIINFLQEPLSPEAEQRAIAVLRTRFDRTAAGYQRTIETANAELIPRTRDLMHPMGIDTAPLRELFVRTGETFTHIEDLLAAIPPDLSVIAEAYKNFQTEVEEVAQEVARLQQEVADGTLGARAQRAAGAARDAGAAAGRAVRDAGPRAARAVGRADREWGRRIERGLDRSGRADSFEDRARRFFHGLGERFRSNLADRLGLGFNSAIIAFHERGVEDIALRTDALREEINNPEDGLVVLIAGSRRILDPSNPDELPPGEIATERREYNRLVRELNARQRDLDRDLGTLERRRAAAQPYFDARQDIATDAKLRLEQYTGERAARYDAAHARAEGVREKLTEHEKARDELSAKIQELRLQVHTERRTLRAGFRRQITRMERELRTMEREIGPRRRTLREINNDIASLAPHVTYWRDQVLPEFTRFSREPVPINHGNFGPREVPGLDPTRHSTRPTPTTPDSFSGAPIAGGGGGGGGPETPTAAPDAATDRPVGVEAGDENITISPRGVAEALFRKWGDTILGQAAKRENMITEMQNFVTEDNVYVGLLDQGFKLSSLRHFITEFNQYLSAKGFNKVDLRTLRTLTRDLRSRAGGTERAAA